MITKQIEYLEKQYKCLDKLLQEIQTKITVATISARKLLKKIDGTTQCEEV